MIKIWEIVCDRCGLSVHITGGCKSQVVKKLKRDGFSVKDYARYIECPDCQTK